MALHWMTKGRGSTHHHLGPGSFSGLSRLPRIDCSRTPEHPRGGAAALLWPATATLLWPTTAALLWLATATLLWPATGPRLAEYCGVWPAAVTRRSG